MSINRANRSRTTVARFSRAGIRHFVFVVGYLDGCLRDALISSTSGLMIECSELVDVSLKQESTVFEYSVHELDSGGQLLSDKQTTGNDYQAVLRGLKSIAQGTVRIEVYNADGEQAGAIGADYWRQRVRRK